MSMDAGRELDALIAKKVMGWEVRDEYFRDGTFAAQIVYNDAGKVRGGPGEGWSPSTKVAQAFEVVDRLTQPVSIYKHVDGSYTVRVGSWSPVAGKEPTMARAQTAPHAICLAAVAALEAGS